MTELVCRLECLRPDDAYRLKQFAVPWSDSWSLQELRLSLDVGDQGIILICDDAPVGYAVYRILPDVIEILNIAIFYKERSKGYGRVLIGFLEDIAREHNCKEVWLEVRSTNQSAISLYRSCGFEVSGTRPGYYRTDDGSLVDAVLMEKPLGE